MEGEATHVEVIEPPAGFHASNCDDCFGQYLNVDIQRSGKVTYEKALTDEEAQEVVNVYIEQIVGMQETVQETLKEYGNVILSRWTKKSKAKREQILRQRTIFEGIGSRTLPATTPWARSNGWILSCARWISLKPFAEDRTRLLSLLHLRSSRHPSEFALLDVKEVHSTFRTADPGRLKHYYNGQSMVMCGQGYGSLVKWDQQLLHTWATVGFPRAVMMPEAQFHLMEFCVEMVEELSNEAEPSGNEKWSNQVALGFKAPGSETIWSNYTNPAFAPPVVFDPNYLLNKATSRLQFALDEIWLMQTDPAYMHLVIKNRRASVVFDPKARPDARVRWSDLARDFTLKMYHRVGFWYVIVIACKEVCRVLEKTGFRRGQRVAEEADDSIWVLLQELHGRIRLLSENLKGLLPTMSTVKSRFTAYQDGAGISYRGPTDLSPDRGPDRLIKIIGWLHEAIQQQPGTYELAMTFDMLERELQSKSSAHFVDNRLLEYLTDIAIMDEMFGIVYHNQIGSCRMPSDTTMTTEEHHKHHVNLYKKNGMAIRQDMLDKLGVRLKAFYESPWPKGKKDLAWLKKASDSRRRLATFWDCYRAEYAAAEEGAKLDPKRSSMDLIKFDTEADFLAELDAERSECEAQSAADTAEAMAKAETAVALLQTESIQTTWGETSEETVPVRRRKTKAKALRGKLTGSNEPSSHEGETIYSTSAEDEDTGPVPIAVKQDTLAVI